MNDWVALNAQLRRMLSEVGGDVAQLQAFQPLFDVMALEDGSRLLLESGDALLGNSTQ